MVGLDFDGLNRREGLRNETVKTRGPGVGSLKVIPFELRGCLKLHNDTYGILFSNLDVYFIDNINLCVQVFFFRILVFLQQKTGV